MQVMGEERGKNEEKRGDEREERRVRERGDMREGKGKKGGRLEASR